MTNLLALMSVCCDCFVIYSILLVLMVMQELHAVPLSLEEEEDVMCAIGRVLSSVTSAADVNTALQRLLKPSHDGIEALVSVFHA